MKKLIYCALALAAMIFASSCQQENLEPVAQENTVTYTVEVPGVDTKAIGDGTNVDQLVYEVWKTGEDGVITESSTRLYQKTINLPEGAPRKWIVTLNLVQNQTYKALFWAQVGEADAYNTENLTKVYWDKNLEDDYSSNQESYAAFYGTDVLNTNTPLKGKTITLTRPFAQLNIGTLNTALTDEYSIKMNQSSVVVTVPTEFNVATSAVANLQEITFNLADVPTAPATLPVSGQTYDYVAMNYVFAGENTTSSVEYTINTTITPYGATEGTPATINKTIPNVPLKENYRTNIVGNLLTSSAQYEVVIDKNFNDQADEFEGGKYGVIDGKQFVRVENIEEFNAAITNANVDIVILQNDIVLSEPLTRSASDPTITISADKELTIDLNGKKLSATSTQTGKNYNMFDVRGTLNVKNGTVEYQHVGDDMGQSNAAEIFYLGFNGKLNLDGVTAKNLGGSYMAYVIDMSNAVNINVNVENSTLESSYITARVFNNSQTGVNNVTIKNSTLKGKYCVWVQYWLGDGRDEATLENTVKLDIFSDDNVYEYTGASAILYGFNEYVYCTANGITKTVSEDGTVVTLGTMVENGVVARYAAGAEENNIVTKAVVGEGISILEDRTFRKYYALETVELPSTLTALGVAGEQYTSGNIFQGCSKLTNITIPESVTTLGMGTFYGCTSLTSINVPAGVTRIEKDTFRETGLTSIEFHEDVTYFGDYAFRDCENLTEVIINAPYFEVGSGTFLNAAGAVPSLTIYVANAEMKEYLEPKVSANKQFKVVATNVVSDKTDIQNSLKEAVKNGETTIVIDAEGASINLAYGFTQSTVPVGTTVTIRNANVEGVSRWNYADGTIIFEDCTFNNPNGAYSIHFDAGKGNIIFKNCDLYGWNSFGSELESVSFENCTLSGNGIYALIRSYTDLTLKNCTINTSNANHTDVYPEGVQVVEGATLTGENISYVVYDETSLQYALNNAAISTIYLNPREEAYIADIYNGTAARESLTIIGSEGTKFGHTATTGGQLRLDLFERFTISNCEIIQRSGVKTWGHIVFSASGNENGVYTIKNCTFNSNGNQGIYINETTSGAVYNIENCTFNGDFGSADGAVTIQNNPGAVFTVNVNGCTFNTNSNQICYLYADPVFTLNTDSTVAPVCLNR